MHFLANYGLFFAKILTLVAATFIVFAGILAIAAKNKEKAKSKGKLIIKNLNEKYQDITEEIQQIILPKKAYKQLRKKEKTIKQQSSQDNTDSKKIYVLNFQGDIRASAVNSFREEITAVLNVATPEDEVVVLLESPGGMVHSYGLAASQLARLRQYNIPLTVIIDKVAASGGYMMAAVANRILAAPFAIIGSIGVVAQIPNFHRLLKKNNIDYEQMTAGEYKRTVSILGEITEKGRHKFQQELEETHRLFKNFIIQYRPQLAIDTVATGEHWLGTDALTHNLIDDITTSDDYLFNANKTSQLYEVSYIQRKTLSDKVAGAMQKSFSWLFSKY